MMAVRSCDCCCFVSRGCGGCAAVEYRHSDLGFRDLQSFRAHPDIKDLSVPTRQQTSVNREPALQALFLSCGVTRAAQLFEALGPGHAAGR